MFWLLSVKLCQLFAFLSCLVHIKRIAKEKIRKEKKEKRKGTIIKKGASELVFHARLLNWF